MRFWVPSKAIHTSRDLRPLHLSSVAVAVGLIVLCLVLVAKPAYRKYISRAESGYSEQSEQFNVLPTTAPSWGVSILALFLVCGGLVGLSISRRKLDRGMRQTNAQFDELRGDYALSQIRFNYLFEATTDAVCCYEISVPLPVDAPLSEHNLAVLEARLRFANNVFIQGVQKDGSPTSIGERYAKLDGAKDQMAHAALVAEFVNSNYQLKDYEHRYVTSSGHQRATRVNMFGAVEDGRLIRFWALGSNATQYRKAKAELARRDNYQQIVADISRRLVTVPDELADQAATECLGRIAGLINADRSALFWLDDDDRSEFSTAYIWHRPEVQPLNAELSFDRFPEISRQLFRNEVVHIDSVAALPDEQSLDRESLQKLGLKSVLMLPLAVGGETVGGLTFSRLVEETNWSDQTVLDVTVFAELIANYVSRLKARRALSEALAGLQNATERLQAENFYLQEEVDREHGFDEIVGKSHSILRCLNQVQQVARTEISVLILGETGTGKELIARAIHARSERSDRPLVKVNCAALPANLIESELFGHERGAFTGAHSRKRGRFDLADGSTLFLDEIGEIPTELQGKLLRVLQEGEFERLGGTKTIRVDVRLLVATNRNLEAAVGSGEFRSDLYYRINTFPIELPPLRERGDDLEMLARHFVNLHAQRLGRDVREISSESIAQLRAYDWPGNVRELDGIIQRALVSNSGPVVSLAEPLVAPGTDTVKPVIVSSNIVDLKLVEREHIVSILDETRWKISGFSGAATRLGIPPSTLRSKMKKLGIERPSSR